MTRPLFTVAELNDVHRETFLAGRVVLTEGIHALTKAECEEIIISVCTYDDFTPENDPYGEHDFGSFHQPGVGKIIWKIDYYDPTMTKGSENPADPEQTCRVLTIMLAEEY